MPDDARLVTPKPPVRDAILATPMARAEMPPTAPMPAAPVVSSMPTPAPVPSNNVPRPTLNPAPSAAQQNAAVFLEKIGPTALNVGLPLVYEIVAHNNAAAPVHNVRVEDEIPNNSRLVRAEPTPEIRGSRLGWNLGTMEPGSERRFKVEVQPSGEGELYSCATITYSAANCLRTVITQPRLVLTKTGPDTVVIGDQAVFQLQMTNTGTGPANNVVLHDRLPPGLQHSSGSSIDADIGTLAPGESKTVSLPTTAAQVGRHVNEATVTADNAAPASAQAVVLVTQPALFLRKTGPQSRFLNREAEFDLEVSNTGSAPATNVRVLDRLPEGLEFISASDGGTYDANTRTIVWPIGTLEPGQRRGLQLKVYGSKGGEYLNRAAAQADRGLEVFADAPLRIEGVPALMLEVVDLDDPAEVGSETTYEIRVINQGSSTTTNLQIIATLPPGMEPREGAGPTPYRIQGQQLAFEPIDKLTARADVLYRVKAVCKRSGDWRFKVQMSSDQLRVPVYEEESTRIYSD